MTIIRIFDEKDLDCQHLQMPQSWNLFVYISKKNDSTVSVIIKASFIGALCWYICMVPGKAMAVSSSQEATTILAFGDSITQGLKRNASGHMWGILYHPNGSRVGGYEPYLEREFSNDGHVAYVHNWGYSGERTPRGLKRFRSIINVYPGVYDYCLLMEGANDLSDGINANTTAFNLGEMADACVDAGAIPIMTTVTPNTHASSGSLIQSYYNPAIVKTAIAKEVILVDQYAAVYPQWESLNSGDGLHVSDLGEQVMAKEWYVALKKKEPPPPVITPAFHLLLLKH